MHIPVPVPGRNLIDATAERVPFCVFCDVHFWCHFPRLYNTVTNNMQVTKKKKGKKVCEQATRKI